LGGTSTSAASKSINAAWLHQMRPDMTVSGVISFAIQDQTAGTVNVVNSGNFTSVVASLAWQYQISDTLGASLRYSFLGQQSPTTANSFYQNMLILGISKTF
jgi:hypothetical protein